MRIMASGVRERSNNSGVLLSINAILYRNTVSRAEEQA
jgi:hypothetical protein